MYLRESEDHFQVFLLFSSRVVGGLRLKKVKIYADLTFSVTMSVLVHCHGELMLRLRAVQALKHRLDKLSIYLPAATFHSAAHTAHRVLSFTNSYWVRSTVLLFPGDVTLLQPTNKLSQSR